MKITCPNCQKKYTINEAKLPTGVKTAKCKACGQRMPLGKPPAKPIRVIKIACQYCGQKCSLQKNAIPPLAKTVKCNSCGRPVPLNQKIGTTPVHSLKKEISAISPRPDKPASESGPRPAVPSSILRFRCNNCGKRYKIGLNKIPPRVRAVKCKDCGHSIQLPHKAAAAKSNNTVAPRAHQDKTPATEAYLRPQTTSVPAPPPRRRKWLFAAACVVLAVVLGALVKLEIIRVDWLYQFIPGKAEKTAQTSPLLDKEPFLALNLNAPEIMELPPSPGGVQTRYAPEPVIVSAVNTEQIKAKLPQMIKESLFPGHYWNREDKPRMTIDMDTLDLPNAAMAELTYEVKSIRSPDGKDVLRVAENKFNSRIQPGSLFPGNISLSIKEGTPPKDLARASIFFHLTVPVALEVFDFAAGDPAGSAQEANGVRATLDGLEKDVARVSSSGGKSMRLIAFDQTGRTLASGESISTASSITTRFEGVINTLKVVVASEVLEYPFEIEVDLNQGKKLVLTREPEIPPRTRFNHHPVPNYVNFKAEALDNLAVKWREGKEKSWNDSLSVKLPQSPFSGHAVWEVHFFGKDSPHYLAGNSTQGPSDFSFTLEKGLLKQAHAAFGKVQISLHSAISRIVFTAGSSGRPATKTLPSGANVSVEFNKNEITYYAGRANVIQTVAYDARGKRLKQDQYTRNKGGKRAIYFWGVPAKFEIDVSTKTITKLIPFEIKQRPVNEKAFIAFRQTIEIQREVVKTIKNIDRARRQDRSYYGDDLAGLYYLHHRKKNGPLKLIGPEIAHSDPAGQKRFGYKVKPYKGYFFTVLFGVETNGVKNGYKRRSKKSNFSWQNGTIITAALTRHPDLVAVPVDQNQPTFFLQWGQVFMKPLNGERLEYLPDGYYNKGWEEAKFIDS